MGPGAEGLVVVIATVGVGGDAEEFESSGRETDAVERIGKIKDHAPRWTSDELPREELEHHNIFSV